MLSIKKISRILLIFLIALIRKIPKVIVALVISFFTIKHNVHCQSTNTMLIIIENTKPPMHPNFIRAPSVHMDTLYHKSIFLEKLALLTNAGALIGTELARLFTELSPEDADIVTCRRLTGQIYLSYGEDIMYGPSAISRSSQVLFNNRVYPFNNRLVAGLQDIRDDGSFYCWSLEQQRVLVDTYLGPIKCLADVDIKANYLGLRWDIIL